MAEAIKMQAWSEIIVHDPESYMTKVASVLESYMTKVARGNNCLKKSEIIAISNQNILIEQ